MKFNEPLHLFFGRWGLLLALLLALGLLALPGCKKVKEDIMQSYFENNILNSDFVVDYAVDNGTDITAQFSGWVFRLTKNTNYDGPMTAKNGTLTYTGTWQSNEDYGKLTIQINQPTVPTHFEFLNRAWRFREKNLPVMKLAPWGSTATTDLYMRRL